MTKMKRLEFKKKQGHPLLFFSNKTMIDYVKSEKCFFIRHKQEIMQTLQQKFQVEDGYVEFYVCFSLTINVDCDNKLFMSIWASVERN